MKYSLIIILTLLFISSSLSYASSAADNSITEESLIFYDTFRYVGFSEWRRSSLNPKRIYHETNTRCLESEDNLRDLNCVIITADDDGEAAYITRSTLNNYKSYKLELDVIPWALEAKDNEYCKISYKFDNNNWIELGRIEPDIDNNKQWQPHPDQIYRFTNSDTSSNKLYIKLETIGDSITDCCIYDNIHLYGYSFPPTSNPTSDPTLLPTSSPTIEPTFQPTNKPTNKPTTDPTCVVSKQLIFYDTFRYARLSKWRKSSLNPKRIYHETNTRCLESEDNLRDLNCVIITADDDGEAAYITRSTLNNYKSYKLELDVIPWALEAKDNEYCKISYKFDNNNWIELGRIEPDIDNNKQWQPHPDQIYRFTNSDTSSNKLYIKLETIGDSITDCCIYDNVHLYGYGC